MLQSTGVEPYLTVAEDLDHVRRLLPAPGRADEVIELVGLARQAGRPGDRALRGASNGGSTSAIALAGDPELLFLDEPTTGFDPSARHEAWEVVKDLADAGQDGVAHHPLHGRGPVPGRPGGGDRRGPDRRRRAAVELGRRDRPTPRVRFRLPAGLSLPDGVSPAASVRTASSSSWPTTRPTLYRLTAGPWTWRRARRPEVDAAVRSRTCYLALTEPPADRRRRATATGGVRHERRRDVSRSPRSATSTRRSGGTRRRPSSRSRSRSCSW